MKLPSIDLNFKTWDDVVDFLLMAILLLVSLMLIPLFGVLVIVAIKTVF